MTDTAHTGVEMEIPATFEEYQRERRKAFIAGVNWVDEWTTDGRGDDADEMRRLYPIRRKVPRTVTLYGGSTARIDGEGALWFELPSGEPVNKARICAQSVAVLRDLLANPFETVES